MLSSAEICKKKCTILGNLRTRKEKRQLDKWPHFYLLFELKLLVIFIFVFGNVKIHRHGVPLWSILVCKIHEFWRWKLWDQNFVSFDSRNIYIKESTKPGFTFSIALRTKFVWSHGLWLSDCFHFVRYWAIYMLKLFVK